MAKSHQTSSIDNFAQNTTIHGVKDLVFSRNRIMKVLWAVLILLTIGGMCEEAYRSLKTFKEAPTAMEVTMELLKERPTILVCASYDPGIVQWYHEAEARSLNFTNEDLALIRMIFEQDNWNEPPIINNISFRNGQINKTKATMDKYGLTTVNDMINLFSWNATTNSEDGTVLQPREKKLIGFTELCQFMTNNFTRNFGINVPEGMEGVTTIVVGEDHSEIRAYPFKNMTELKISEISQSILLNSPRHPCNDQISSRYICENDCSVKLDICRCNGSMLKHYYFNTNEKFLNIDPQELDCRTDNPNCEDNYEKCIKSCNPCKIWNFQITEGEVLSTGVWIRTTDIMSVSIEYYTYPATSLLGNIGGLVSLFCGASILSVVQLVVFCWDRACKKAVD